MNRFRLLMLVGAPAILLALLIGTTVSAGGWAVITVEQLPQNFVVGQQASLPFTVRQHGVRLMEGLKPTVIATKGQEVVTAKVSAVDQKYVADFTIPSTGSWTITIKSSFGNNNVTLLPINAVAANKASHTALTKHERGKQLYVAKGCIACHQNDQSGVKPLFGFASNLTDKRYKSDYLARLITNPEQVLPGNKDFLRMPKLGLQPDELSALVSFMVGSEVKSD